MEETKKQRKEKVFFRERKEKRKEKKEKKGEK